MTVDNRAKWLARQIMVTRENPDGHIAVELQTASLCVATISEGGIPVATGVTTYPDHLLRALLEELNVRVVEPMKIKATGS